MYMYTYTEYSDIQPPKFNGFWNIAEACFQVFVLHMIEVPKYYYYSSPPPLAKHLFTVFAPLHKKS